jgi:cytochrome c oxidase assembly protein subunit 11
MSVFIRGRLPLLRYRLDCRRPLSTETKASPTRNADTLIYCTSAIIGLAGLIYASVPLYRIFCQKTGFAGTPKKADVLLQAKRLRPVPGARPIQITFDSHISKNLGWTFKPEQRILKVVPGQTALAFYSAANPSDSPLTGVATYNVFPSKAAQYFNKIQCFCFEEQSLDPGEQVDMPVFFYLDPEFAFDPAMDNVSEIILSYTFFKSSEK